MEAGRDLDALIAEKVMGYRMKPEHNEWDYFPIPILSWHPSADIAAAWQVVEKLCDRPGVEFMVKLMEPSAKKLYGFRWYAAVTVSDSCDQTEEFDRTYTAFADTAPLAICLAALKAVEVKP